MSLGTYSLFVDWNNDGDITDANEDLSARLQSVTWTLGRNAPSHLSGVCQPGKLTAKLENQDGLLSNFGSGALAGNILPGRKVTLKGNDGSTTRTLFVGYLERIEPSATVGGLRTCTLRAIGPLGRIRDRNVALAKQTAALTSACVTAVLTAVGWSGDDSTIGTGKISLALYNPSDPNSTVSGDAINVLQALRQLEVAESGFLREGKDGKIIFEHAHHRAALTSSATFSDASAAALTYQGVRELDSLSIIFNNVETSTPVASTGSVGVLWTLPTVVSLQPGQQRTYVATYPNDDSATNAVGVNAWTTTASGTDMVANSNSGGSGTVLTSDIAIGTNVKTATTMSILLTNNSGVLAYITELQARGTPDSGGDPIVIKQSDSTSQTTYGQREFTDGPQYLSAENAGDWCDYALDYAKDLRPALALKVHANRTTATLTQVHSRDISDVITVTATGNAGLGHNAREFFIESMTHRVSAGSGAHEVTWLLSDAQETVAASGKGYIVLDTGKVGGRLHWTS